MDDEVTDGLNRRTALKRIGAGAALAWSAPAILSASSASAVTGSPLPTSCDVGYVCGVNDPPDCGAGAGLDCYCITTVSGQIVCVDVNATCGNACTSDADCGPNSVCQSANSGCCGQVCVTGMCGDPIPARVGNGRSNLSR